ncbi:4-oxalomesaconate tautomerase (plasmid) [Photobacterium sp. DA100]|uniref:4-oxalomesaconate tautomerase n=1 Tax=Photobacterium sp. DA100 TaxID=3027472 RepID=UPI002479D3B5|nr:4-oxalomesaconate tautomerase [Photobacterium sp. DA100]WEM44664.1 4-oxalomesaconate tautomerase [Photobacterium sp. DA100]
MSDLTAVRCMWMRGGTSKGAYFLASDLPSDPQLRDNVLLGVMGSPDPRQIDGMGGADPLTSKVAIITPSQREGVDVDYLFLQVFVDKPVVSDGQNCGNILAGVAPFAIERGLVEARDGETSVTVYMENTGQIAECLVPTPNKIVSYQGNAAIDGVPGTAAPIAVTFRDTAGSSCGALLPTGRQFDNIDGVATTLIDNGMPVVVIRAEDVGIEGNESRDELDNNEALKARLESIRLQAGPMMNLGDVTDKSVPKMSLVSPAQHGGAISTRTFIPHRCHASIGVLGAVSVASACLLPKSPAFELASVEVGDTMTLDIEHPTGALTVIVNRSDDDESAAILRTAKKLFDGNVFVANQF